MAQKLRVQNPVIGDTIRLKFDVYNSNNYSDVNEIEKVEIYYLDPTARTEDNPDGRTLFATIDGGDVVRSSEGQYYADLVTSSPSYVIGNYIDMWHVRFKEGEEVGTVENYFTIFPDLWITSPVPIIYDFQFKFYPVRWRQGEKKSLQIDITPLVPRQSDLLRYYTNLAIAADLYLYIEKECGDCLPCESDLRLVIEEELIDYRENYKEKCTGFYKWDTADVDCGIYNVWVKMNFGDNTYISEKSQLQVYK